MKQNKRLELITRILFNQEIAEAEFGLLPKFDYDDFADMGTEDLAEALVGILNTIDDHYGEPDCEHCRRDLVENRTSRDHAILNDY